MALQDLINQLDTEITEHTASMSALTQARTMLTQAQIAADSATVTEAQEKQDVIDLFVNIRDAAQAEIDRLNP